VAAVRGLDSSLSRGQIHAYEHLPLGFSLLFRQQFVAKLYGPGFLPLPFASDLNVDLDAKLQQRA